MNEGHASSTAESLEDSSPASASIDVAAIHLEAAQLWPLCLAALAQELPEQQYITWIKPLQAAVNTDLSKLTVVVANRFKLDWVRAQYAAKIAATAERICRQATGQGISLELALAPRESSARPASSTPTGADFASVGSVTQANHSGDLAGQIPPLLNEEEAAGGFKSRINTALTFDTLVEGSANRMARAAAMHVSNNMGALYNPLFIYGGVGLGKTHLLHAVGNQLLATKPGAKVMYTHAEQFVSDVVRAYQRKTFDEFKARYQQLDLLLIDYVQFFSNL